VPKRWGRKCRRLLTSDRRWRVNDIVLPLKAGTPINERTLHGHEPSTPPHSPPTPNHPDRPGTDDLRTGLRQRTGKAPMRKRTKHHTYTVMRAKRNGKGIDARAVIHLREKGTERAFTVPTGTTTTRAATLRACGKCCSAATPSSTAAPAWPSFYAPADKAAVEEHSDRSFGMVRTEVFAATAAGTWATVRRGPDPTGLRIVSTAPHSPSSPLK
jgi:peptide-methionine (R)-S-oxide reductase